MENNTENVNGTTPEVNKQKAKEEKIQENCDNGAQKTKPNKGKKRKKPKDSTAPRQPLTGI